MSGPTDPGLHRRRHADGGSVRPPEHRDARGHTAGSALDALHRTAGNRAISTALAGTGVALDPELRTEMEARLGHDLSRVRVHDDPAAADSARELAADAYTLGRDIVFAANRFAPDTEPGRSLLAHELAHVVQQRNIADPRPELGPAHDGFERAAGRAAAGETTALAPLPATAPALQRQPARTAAPPAQQKGPRRPEITEKATAEMKADVEAIVEELRATFTDEWRIVKILLYWEEKDRIHQEQTGYAGTDYLDAFLLQTKLRAYSHAATGAPWATQYGIVYDDVWHELGGERRRIWKDRVAKSRQGSEGPREGPAENFWKTLSRQEAIGMVGMLKGMGTAAASGLVDTPANAIVKALQKAGVPVDTPESAATWLAKQYDITGQAAFGKDWSEGEVLFLGLTAADIGTMGGTVIWQLVMLGKGKQGAWATGALTAMGVIGNLDGVATSAQAIAGMIEQRQKAGRPIEASELANDPEFRKAASGLVANAVGLLATAAGMRGGSAAGTAPAAQAAAKVWKQVGLAIDSAQFAERLGTLIQEGLSDEPAAVKDKKIASAIADVISTGISAGVAAKQYSEEYGRKPGGAEDEQRKQQQEQQQRERQQEDERQQRADEERSNQEQRRREQERQQSENRQGEEPPADTERRERQGASQKTEKVGGGGGGGGEGGGGAPEGGGEQPPARNVLVGPVAKARKDRAPRNLFASEAEARTEDAKAARVRGPLSTVSKGPEPAAVRKEERARAAKFRARGLSDPSGNRLGTGGETVDEYTPAQIAAMRRDARRNPVIVQPEVEILSPPREGTGFDPDRRVTLTGEDPPPRATTILGPDGKPVGSRVQVQVGPKLQIPPGTEAGFKPQGLAYEAAALANRFPAANVLPPNFPVFDGVEGGRVTVGPNWQTTIEGGTAISVRRADMGDKGYATADGTYNNLRSKVNDAAKYGTPGHKSTTLSGVSVINPHERVLNVELTKTPTAEQLAGLSRLQSYAAEKNVTLRVNAPEGDITAQVVKAP